MSEDALRDTPRSLGGGAAERRLRRELRPTGLQSEVQVFAVALLVSLADTPGWSCPHVVLSQEGGNCLETTAVDANHRRLVSYFSYFHVLM